MSEAKPLTAEERAAIRAAAEKATKGEWRYRPDEFDDWGTIKGPPRADLWGRGLFVANARSGERDSEEAFTQHRRDGTDPYAHNAAYIVAAQPSVVLRLLDDFDAERAKVEALERDKADILQSNSNYCAEIEARATAAEAEAERMREALRHCPHDGGFDMEAGPVGCRLATLEMPCVCAGVFAALAKEKPDAGE